MNFTDQPISIPANLAFALLQYIGSRPANETAGLLIGLQQTVTPQLQAVEAAYVALNQPQDETQGKTPAETVTE